ncbi:excinuclease ABC subunit UvrA [Mycoplasmoides fastidiosum]|nr:excinuclease ABC subunit UvrA [Mycoplasmoides fastidiosum]UUD38135.1 excinuclease ABC subunit UvrA [Mycoplasmoides fastidiosum]
MIKGAREHNLKNIDLNIPKNQLVVITGLSGSGKSSLAFDTVYAEGQRRFLNSLSAYARHFLASNNFEKPDVDSIDGLSPAISVNQKNTSHNPRSTVGTVTEVFDYLRLLFARIATPTCPNGHGPIEAMTIAKIAEQITNLPAGTKLQILAPVARQEKGTFKNRFQKFKNQGYLRLMVDGLALTLDDEIKLDRNKAHNIDIIIDRIVLQKTREIESRVYASVEIATNETNGLVNVHYILPDSEQHQSMDFSQKHACKVCGFSIPQLEPRLFSFNSPVGACKECDGLGVTFEPDPEKIFLHSDLSIFDGGIDFFKNTVNTQSLDWQRFEHLLKHYKIDVFKPVNQLSDQEIEWIMYGSEEPIQVKLVSSGNRTQNSFDYVEGVGALIKRRHLETQSDASRDNYIKYMSEYKCKACKGHKLSKQSLSFLLNEKNIMDVSDMEIENTINFLLNLKLTEEQRAIGKLALKEIVDRLSFLIDVGLGYLTLSRNASSLSGGELQRIRLASQIGSSLTGVLYVLDEPSIGLHQRDNSRLINALKKMRDLGNTVLVVEHDEETMLESDYLIDIGPKAGIFGGEVTAAGTPGEVMENPNSLTGQYLSKKRQLYLPPRRRIGNGQVIKLRGAKGNNLKNVNVDFPLGKLIVVTGPSGSGKSTLINETLVKGISKELFNRFETPMPYESLNGHQNIEKIIRVSTSPISRTSRSNPATYIGLFDDIRDLFALLPESKARNYLKGRFSFNVRGGRCETCEGEGVRKIEMYFLAPVYVTCEACNGKKYNQETLDIKYHDKSIYDVLDMTAIEALELFKNIPTIRDKLQLMCDVGIDYLKLGATASSLSGGEAQRIKLAKFLQKKSQGNALFVLDEPTTGLHVHNIGYLIDILNRIVDRGDTVIVIEHNLELIKMADHIIDLGPEGGKLGGQVLATGTPEQICTTANPTHTAKYLAPYLNLDK